ncbi:MAG: helix-turn-helix domain-containing protein [Clostridiales bacterium]|nr:helix-turn-helix domain-containing protein [Clostridiales bacterium]
MKRIPVLFQLIIILSIVLIIPLSIVSQYFSSNMIQYSEDEIVSTELSNLRSDSRLTETVLFNAIDDAFQLVQDGALKKIKNIRTYKELNSDYENILVGLNVYNAIKTIQSNNNEVYSAYFYLEGADYVISSNRGIVLIDDFASVDWLTTSDNGSGAKGVWYSRKISKSSINELKVGIDNGELDVLSYVYRLNSLTTSTRGAIVINFYESRISEELNDYNSSSNKNVFIIDTEGNVITHSNKELLYSNLQEDPMINKIIEANTNNGHELYNMNNKNYLYSYYKIPRLGWIFISTHPMDALMEKTNNLLQNYVFMTIMAILIGTALSVAIAYGFSKPIRQLAREVKKTFKFDKIKNHRNEFAFITEAMDEFQRQENKLREALKTQEKETKKMALYNLLHGDLKEELEIDVIEEMFPHEFFVVIIMTLDKLDKYRDKTNSEIRRYRRSLLYQIFDKAFPAQYHVSSARYEGDEIAIIINSDIENRSELIETIQNSLQSIKNDVQQVLDNTVTFGISKIHRHRDNVKECVFEATEAIKKRMVVGGDSIHLYVDDNAYNMKFHFFHNNENRIVNYLDSGDAEGVKREIMQIVSEIKKMDNITNENILLIFSQLIGTAVKYLADNNINAGKVFGNKINNYAVIWSMDTVDEIADYVNGLFQSIISYSTKEQINSVDYWQLIDKYINEHYKEDFLFEDLADNIGISYSYMRKIVKNETGKSLIDLLNQLRIEEAKRLLVDTDDNILDIALSVGYRNTQSFNRYFKKYLGISPNQYRKQVANNMADDNSTT